MQAEVYIKARKVFVPDKVENTEKCPHCNEEGQTYFLRYFYLSLEEAVYKCGNSKCLYPFHHFVFKNLRDKTVYYYEEVEDGTNDIMLKVSTSGQDKYKSANPMRTVLFSESQHNPDIESYDFDIFDFMNDNTPAQSASIATTAKLNDDYLDFLDEIPIENANTYEKNLDTSGVDSFIDNLLNSTPNTSSIIWPNQQNSPSKTEEVKLSKAVEHIEKVKGRKKVKEEKPQETFLQRVRKTKAAQSMNKRKASVTEKVSTLVGSAKNLRPTQFINQLKSLDLKNSNSGFLRTLAKVKENNKSGVPSSNVEVKDEPIIPTIEEPTKPAQTKKRRSIKKEKKELTVEKKLPKPRKKPVKRLTKVVATTTVVKVEPIDNEPTEAAVYLEKNKKKAKSLGDIPINIDLSKISLPKKTKTKKEKIIQINETPKICVKRSRKKKTEVERPKPKRVKIEQLDEHSVDLLTTMKIQNDEIIAAPSETIVTVSKSETKLQIDAEMPQLEMRTEVEPPSKQNDSKSDEEAPFAAFSPVTDSDLSSNSLMDLKTLKFTPNASTSKKTPVRRTYKRRAKISANTKKVNEDSDTQSEIAPIQVSVRNAKQRPKPKRAVQNRNNNNTDFKKVEKEIEISLTPRYLTIELSDHSGDSDSSQHVMTIDVEDDTSRNSNEINMSESIVNLGNHMEDIKSKLNVNNRCLRKKFGKVAEKGISVSELMQDWDSASADSEISN